MESMEVHWRRFLDDLRTGMNPREACDRAQRADMSDRVTWERYLRDACAAILVGSAEAAVQQALVLEGVEALAAIAKETSPGEGTWLKPASAVRAVAVEHLCELLVGHTSYVEKLLVDGDRLYSAGDSTIRVWDLRDGRCLHTVEAHRAIQDIALIQGRGRIVSIGSDGTLRLWESEGLRCLSTHTLAGRCNHIAAHPNGSLVAVGGPGCAIELWDMDAGRMEHQLEGGPKGFTALAFDAQGRLASCAKGGEVTLWSVGDGQVIATFETGWEYARQVAFHPDGERLVAADSGRIRWYEMGRGLRSESRRELPYGDAFELTDDGVTAFATDRDGGIWHWDLARGEVIAAWHGGVSWNRCLAIDAQRGALFTAGSDHTIRRWDLAGHRCADRAVPAKHRGITAIAHGARSRTAVAINDFRRPWLHRIDDSDRVGPAPGGGQVGESVWVGSDDRVVITDSMKGAREYSGTSELLREAHPPAGVNRPEMFTVDGRPFWRWRSAEFHEQSKAALQRLST